MIVTFLLLEGYSNFVLSCLLEPLRMIHEQYQEDITWQIITADDQVVLSSSGLRLLPSIKRDQIDHSDILVIISSNDFRQHVTPENQRLAMSLVRQSDVVLGADAGAWLLASTGLLDELPATLHWSVLAEFAETYPQVRVKQDSFVMEGRFWSCGGASGALDLMQTFIADRFGPARALAVSSMFTYDAGGAKDDTPNQNALPDFSTQRLNNVLNIMIDTIEYPVPLVDIAKRTHMSTRTLNRLFKNKLGVSPGQYYQGLRLSRAQDLARSTQLGLREIALRCGYNDAAALSKAFRKTYDSPLRKVVKESPPEAAFTRQLNDGL
ncbi:GlxA family transcriptional regulator [Thalassospira lucentensis]|uniref:GlxA family transcriptional regulator n=1 Tax=Thalassospira lucentensis TaxID=168935 RepID=UPI003AA7F3C6